MAKKKEQNSPISSTTSSSNHEQDEYDNSVDELFEREDDESLGDITTGKSVFGGYSAWSSRQLQSEMMEFGLFVHLHII